MHKAIQQFLQTTDILKRVEAKFAEHGLVEIQTRVAETEIVWEIYDHEVVNRTDIVVSYALIIDTSTDSNEESNVLGTVEVGVKISFDPDEMIDDEHIGQEISWRFRPDSYFNLVTTSPGKDHPLHALLNHVELDMTKGPWGLMEVDLPPDLAWRTLDRMLTFVTRYLAEYPEPRVRPEAPEQE